MQRGSAFVIPRTIPHFLFSWGQGACHFANVRGSGKPRHPTASLPCLQLPASRCAGAGPTGFGSDAARLLYALWLERDTSRGYGYGALAVTL